MAAWLEMENVLWGFKNVDPPGPAVAPFGGYVGDFNGDGVTDVVSGSDGRFAYISPSPLDNLMTKASNGYGAEIEIAYRPSSAGVH